MKQILTICALVFFSFVFSQNSQLVEIETNDGNIFLGSIIEENEDGYVLKTQDGIQINVPLSSVKNISKIFQFSRSTMVSLIPLVYWRFV